MAHASAPDHTFGNYQMDQDNSVDNEPCHSEQDQSHDENACDDCCCVHSHVMATSVTPTKTALNVNQQNVIATVVDHYSADLSGLKRPPRL